MNKVDINGVNFFTTENTLDLIDTAVNNKKNLIAINLEKILTESAELKRYYSDNIGYPDGVFAARSASKLLRKPVKKIRGVDLWIDVMKYAQRRHLRVFIYGSRQGVLDSALRRLKEEGLNDVICQAFNGYEYPIEEISKAIIKSKPDIVLLALGSPKQELVAVRLEKLWNCTYMGLGGSLDVYSGLVSDTPLWWRKLVGWEGLYRVFINMSNLSRWKRQLVVIKLIKAKLKGTL